MLFKKKIKKKVCDRKDIDKFFELLDKKERNRKDLKELNKLIKKIDIATLKKDGFNLIFHAIRHNDLDVLERIIKQGADVNDTNNMFKTTPLIEATILGYLEIVELLIEKGADPNIRDTEGKTALIHLVEKGFASYSKLIMCSFRNSACGIYNPYFAILKTLIKKTDVDIQDKNGWSAIMYATKNNDIVTFKKLLKSGASIFLKDVEGNGILDLTESKEIKRIVEKEIKTHS